MKQEKLFEGLTYKEVDDIFDSLWSEEEVPQEPKCECGSAKIYGKNTKLHSFWCPLHETSK
jgi:hypothetical protein